MTTTGPVVAPLGTVTPILVLVQLVGVASVPLKLTVLPTVCVPKLFPLTVTAVPTPPVVTERLVMLGTELTLNGSWGYPGAPPTVTTMYPLDVAPEGTGTTIWLFDQLVGVAAGPLTVTVL